MIFAQHNFHLTFASHCYRLKSLEAYMSFARAGPPKAAPARVVYNQVLDMVLLTSKLLSAVPITDSMTVPVVKTVMTILMVCTVIMNYMFLLK